MFRLESSPPRHLIMYSQIVHLKKKFWPKTSEVHVQLKISCVWGPKPNANPIIQFGGNPNHGQLFVQCRICLGSWGMRAVLSTTYWEGWQNGNLNITKLTGRQWTHRTHTVGPCHLQQWLQRWPYLSSSGWRGRVGFSKPKDISLSLKCGKIHLVGKTSFFILIFQVHVYLTRLSLRYDKTWENKLQTKTVNKMLKN